MDRNIHSHLLELAEGNGEYAEFNKKIANTQKQVLGVRTPDMRRFAKALAKGKWPESSVKGAGAKDGTRATLGGGAGERGSGGTVGEGAGAKGSGGTVGEGASLPPDAHAVHEFIRSADKDVFEHVLLVGMLVNYAKLTDKERIGLAREYLKYADSWALIDMFAEKMKNYDRRLWWDFAVRCLSSTEEYTVRYGVIILMSNYLDDDSLDRVFTELRKITHDGYYVKMGIAWLYAEAAITYYEKTLAEVGREGKDIWTSRKALTKMLESFRFTDKQKNEIRAQRAALPKAAK